jgi:hypothetical protein
MEWNATFLAEPHCSLIFLFLDHTLQGSKSSPESLNKRILAVASSSKLLKLETLHSLFELCSVPVPVFTILTITNHKESKSLSKPTGMFMGEENAFKT